MASFSQQVKDEIIRLELSGRQHCIKAELAAIIHLAGSLHLVGREQVALSVATESAGIARRIVKLFKAAYTLEGEIQVEEVGKLGKLRRYIIKISPQPELNELLLELGLLSRENTLENDIKPQLVKERCCRAAFFRGAFLAAGSITDPQKKTYHLEMIVHNEDFSNGLIYLLNLLGIKAKIGQRKGKHLVYLKDSEAIAKFLSLINANTGVIKLEEVRVIKSLRGEVNRLVNCETANLEKTLSAAWEQVENIQKLRGSPAWFDLPENLKITAELRLEHPEASLKELGEYHQPPLSKSAVNHRLRKIRELAAKVSKRESGAGS
ncbi:MAG: DNA-binding protein WhiA [Firmicutes bacterium]|nr:DNA-binding protein WhiA [Bacillota bacterium]